MNTHTRRTHATALFALGVLAIIATYVLAIAWAWEPDIVLANRYGSTGWIAAAFGVPATIAGYLGMERRR